jgi:hypothetical protein
MAGKNTYQKESTGMRIPTKLLEEFRASLAGKAEPTQDACQRELKHSLAMAFAARW